MKYTNKSFSVGGKCCGGCDQRDIWLKQKDDEIERLKGAFNEQLELVNSKIITTWPDIAARLIKIAKSALKET